MVRPKWRGILVRAPFPMERAIKPSSRSMFWAMLASISLS